MRPICLLSALLFVTAASLPARPPGQTATPRAVAVTFDDLPATAAGVVRNDPASLEALTRKLLGAVRKHKVPAVGFVNEGSLFVDGERPVDATRRIGLLEMWAEAGLELGNHTYSHADLNKVPLEQFQADVLRGEKVTREVLKKAGRTLRYFRHPFLHTGDELRKRRAFEAFLTTHGYVVAPVTVDTDDFVYAAAYSRALRAGDVAHAARILDDYRRYMNEVFTYFEGVSRRVTGRDISHIVLLHANALNADGFATLADDLVRRGYRFVPIAEALEDPVYTSPDDFVGAPGNSWFNHWAITAGGKPVPTPAPPSWIKAP
jgi:peptidoglycan/xylan/chitin deacetylase (PgdA/CDA1 family)